MRYRGQAVPYKMGFGSDLRNSQEAVLKLQDWELRLLETVKKFMALRIKSDKEYAYTLQNLCNQVDKESTVQVNYVSNVSKVRVILLVLYSNIVVHRTNGLYYRTSIPMSTCVLKFLLLLFYLLPLNVTNMMFACMWRYVCVQMHTPEHCTWRLEEDIGCLLWLSTKVESP